MYNMDRYLRHTGNSKQEKYMLHLEIILFYM